MQILTVAEAAHAEVARLLVHEYFLGWGIEEVTDRGLLDELARIDHHYGPPSGGLVIATVDDVPAGVVAFKHVDDSLCEMKRLFVRPAFRRRRIGEAMVERLLADARRAGYERMRLDTPSDNHPALAMYHSLGFIEIEPYYEIPPDHPIQSWTFLATTIDVTADEPVG